MAVTDLRTVIGPHGPWSDDEPLDVSALAANYENLGGFGVEITVAGGGSLRYTTLARPNVEKVRTGLTAGDVISACGIVVAVAKIIHGAETTVDNVLLGFP